MMMCVCRVVVVVVWQCSKSISTMALLVAPNSSNNNSPPSLSFFPNALHSPLVIVLPSPYLSLHLLSPQIDRRRSSGRREARERCLSPSSCVVDIVAHYLEEVTTSPLLPLTHTLAACDPKYGYGVCKENKLLLISHSSLHCVE